MRVTRTTEIEEFRSRLPAVMTEQEVVDAVRNNLFSIICGGTGCGKSTQVPQFLYEAGFTEGTNEGMIIGVTQPRRVAAVAVSQRVGFELNNPNLVGYQVRYDKKISSENMRIKFMTDGILLREIQDDIRLPHYSVIVIDEPHERSINCDLLLGLLSGSIRVRQAMNKPLRVVVMSATLNMTDFTKNSHLMTTPTNPSKNSSPPVVSIDNKMFPVTVHYERRTQDDYLGLAIDKIDKIHNTLPPGTILVFVTGKHEVHQVCNAFRDGYRVPPTMDDDEEFSQSDNEEEKPRNTQYDNPVVAVKKLRPTSTNNADDDSADFTLGNKDDHVEELVFDKSGEAATATTSPVSNGGEGFSFSGGGPGSRLRIFPLYAQMSPEKQMEVFEAVENFPEDRIVVVTTNVAETSLTIPNVRYVIDSGREKRREFNANGVSRFVIRFTSKASANQRSGRCGRVGSGHVYRLYSPNVFGEHMAEFSSPEIEVNPLDSAILLLMKMGVPSMDNFPWPTRPPKPHVDAALKRLRAINAIDNGKITKIGESVSQFPISPRLAVAIIQGQNRNDPQLVLCLCGLSAMLSVDCVMEADRNMQNLTDDFHAILVWLKGWFLCSPKDREKFCTERSLSLKGMREVSALFFQLVKICRLDYKTPRDANGGFADIEIQESLLAEVRQCCIHGFVDQIGYRDQAGSKAYRAPGNSDEVYIHKSSALYKRRPQWVGFVEMVQASGEFSDKRTMRTCFVIDPEYLGEKVETPLIDRKKPHPLMKPRTVGQKRYGYFIPKYLPLSLTITECITQQIE